MGYLKTLFLTAFIAIFLNTSMLYAYPVRFEITQVSSTLPSVQVFTILKDENDRTLSDFVKTDFTANIDGNPQEITGVNLFKDTNKGVAYTVLLDISGTMKGRPFKSAKKHLKHFISVIRDVDYMSIIAFGNHAKIINDFTNKKNALTYSLNSLTPNAQKTLLYKALYKAFELNTRTDEKLPLCRAIILITDGKDEGSGITIDDLLQKKQANSIPIFSVGYTKIDSLYLDILKRLSGLSTGNFFDAKTGQDNFFDRIIDEIYSQHVLSINAPDVKVNLEPQSMQIIFNKNGYKITDERPTVFLHKNPPTPAITTLETPLGEQPEKESQHLWIYVVVIALIILTTIVLFFAKKNRNKQHDSLIEEDNDKDIITDSLQDDDSVDDSHNTIEAEPFINLRIIKGKDSRKTLDIYIDETGKTIGAMGSDIVIRDGKAQEHHCSIIYKNNVLLLSDNGSKTGTYLNGIPVTAKARVEEDDIITVGNTSIRVKFNI